MNSKYNHKEIEKKWQEKWQKAGLFKTDFENNDKEKFYLLDMFPYPSGDGLHMGHTEQAAVTDTFYRYKRMRGLNVLHPQGFDSFGLPAENYAIKTGLHPAETIKNTTTRFKEQIDNLGLAYDFVNDKVNTSKAEYYKHTQAIFGKFFENDIAYKKTAKANWCESCKTVIATEQMENGKCERCGTEIEQKDVPSWMFRITDFADDLIWDEKNKDIDWPSHTKINQNNWIGKSVGAEINFKILDSDKKIKVFTTRPDTLFGVTYMVLAPEHSLVQELKAKITNWDEVEKYISDTKKKTELERLEGKEKTGVKLEGVFVENPANGEVLPIFISDYVLAGYGTGAIMAVPAHDERDYDFANTMNAKSSQNDAEFTQKDAETTQENTVIKIKEVVALDYILENEMKPRDDVETLERRTIDVIIEREDGKILLQKDSHWHFVGGGVEEGDSLEETVKKEIIEETGFLNFTIKKKFLDNLFVFGYRETKNKNQKTNSAWYHVKLNNEEQQKSEIDDGKHIIEWVDRKDIAEKIEWPHHVQGWNIFNGEIFSGNGILVNSGEFDGMESEEAKKAITEFVGGKMTSTYRLRDWSISRQRYWGTPIPIVYDPEGRAHFVGEENLPWLLATDVDFVPTGIAPLAKSKELFERTEKLFGKGWTPEVDTMDTFVDSSWYFLRYCNPENEKEFANSERLKKWMPVDLYIGGAEHTYMHLLFARFFVKAMKKIGLLDFDEPFLKLRHQGMVKDINGKKMSKSKGNVVNPDDMVERFGADATRAYMLFSSPLEDDVIWNEDNIVGVYRFLEKVWRQQEKVTDEENLAVKKELHKTIKSVTEKIEDLRFNTAISDMMKFINFVDREEKINKKDFSDFLKILYPFAPHISDELRSRACSLVAGSSLKPGFVENASSSEFYLNENWPEFDSELATDDLVKIGIQINGKRRAEIEVASETTENEVREKVLAMEEVKKWVEDKEIKKFIYVPQKIISLIV